MTRYGAGIRPQGPFTRVRRTTNELFCRHLFRAFGARVVYFGRMAGAGTSQRQLRQFYEAGYSHTGDEARRYERWRALGAQGKAARALRALGDLPGSSSTSVLEIGCGDGSVLAELRGLRPGWSFSGVEIADAAARIAQHRNPEATIRTYDGERLPWPEAAFDVGLLSHVVEHVVDPRATLREAARVCRTLVVEVPLEGNLSAARRGKRRGADAIGHLHRFTRRDVREIVEGADLVVAAELTDPLPREVHRFFADTRQAGAAADLRWLVRAALHRSAPRLAERVFTVHYLAVCVRRGG
jgi:SAM-dependent methyltransferase